MLLIDFRFSIFNWQLAIFNEMGFNKIRTRNSAEAAMSLSRRRKAR
jgi:hypothetical protein